MSNETLKWKESMLMKENEIEWIELILLYSVTLIGMVVNLIPMIFLCFNRSYRIKSSCFLFHHCLICLTLSFLCFPYSLSFQLNGIRCDYLGNIHVTCVTAQLLNIAAMVASEAYRFEDLIHQDHSSKTDLRTNHHSRNTSSEERTTTTTQRKKKREGKMSSNHFYFEYEYEQGNHSTISCGCLSFGICIIWFSSVILHLGIH